MTMTYEAWRASFQDSEQAARAAFSAALERAAEKDSCAAHADRLASWIKQHGWHSDECSALGLDDEGLHKGCSCGLTAAWETPETSLALRDATVAAETLEELAELPKRWEPGELFSEACKLRLRAGEISAGGAS